MDGAAVVGENSIMDFCRSFPKLKSFEDGGWRGIEWDRKVGTSSLRDGDLWDALQSGYMRGCFITLSLFKFKLKEQVGAHRCC